VKVLAVVAGLALAAGPVGAQLAVHQPTEKIAVLPLAAAPADSALSLQVMDVARQRLEGLAKYKVYVVPKSKLCEVLGSSGYSCDDLLDADEARNLARHLSLQAYTVGRLERKNGRLTAAVRIIDIGSSGFARAFSAEDASAEALGEAIAQRMNAVIRAGEHARECTQQRSRGQLQRAVNAARKALQADEHLTGAHLCLILTYEAMKMPPDSLIAVAERALKGDPENSTALTTIASAWLQKGDSAKAMEARYRQWQADRKNKPILLGLVQIARMKKDIPRAVQLVDEGLREFPNDPQLGDIRTTLCIEGELSCSVDALIDQTRRDTTKLRDTAFVKVVIGAAQKHQRAEECRRFSAIGTAVVATSTSFWKARGACYELGAMLDSAKWAYRRASDLDPTDIAGALLVAKAMVDGAALDSNAVRRCAGDTACVGRVRTGLSARMDTARVYIERGLKSSDSTLRFSAIVIDMTAGQKLAQAQAYVAAEPWLERVLQAVAPRFPGDTLGPRAQVRGNTSFWWGLASTITLAQPFQAAVESKKCDRVKPIIDRLQRTKQALQAGRRIHPPTADQMLGVVARYEANVPRIREAYRCKNF
jgi:tetratricopeptide (TPR) repeat protein